jgi:hypothetical protein
MHPLHQIELERLGVAYGTLTLVRYLLARVAEKSGQPAEWLAEAKEWAEHNVKSAVPEGLSDEESLVLTDKALAAIKVAFSGIRIEHSPKGQLRTRA